MTDCSHKTAIARRGPSAPAKALQSKGLLRGRMLDYGCGRGADADYYGMDQYDPHYSPEPAVGKFDTITCTFVLNVIRLPELRQRVLEEILDYLKPDGRAYITVRTDVKEDGHTSTGSWQGIVRLSHPVVARGSGYVTHVMRKYR